MDGALTVPELPELDQLNRAQRRHVQRELARACRGGRARLVGSDIHPVSTSSAQLREAFRRQGHDVDDELVRELVAAGKGPVGGGATGRTAAAYAQNLPAEGSYVMDPQEFALWTERNDMPLEQKALSGLGAAPIQQRISNVGIMSALRIVFKGTLTVGGTGAVTATYQWPWNVVKRFALNLNGQTSILSCEGMDLRARRQRFFRNPRESVVSAPATDTATGDPNPGVISNGTYAVVLVWDIPVAHDVFTLVGSIYAQSDQVYLQQQITPGAQAELFSVAAGGTVTLTGTFSTTLTFYDIPVDPNKGVVLIPDMRYLHGYFSADQPYANVGEVQVAFIRSAGQLTSFALYLDNGGAAVIDMLALSALRFQYGGNRRPREYNPVEQLIEKNQQDYNGRILPKAGYGLLDFEADNPERELVYPKGVTELAVVATIPAGTTINANARAHFIEETLFAGR